MSQIFDSRKIKEAYRTTKHRIFFLDYDGTLVAFKDKPGDSVLDEQSRFMLFKLLSDVGNQIYIISGRTREFLDQQFEKYPVGLIAEHGFLLKRVNGEWLPMYHCEKGWKKSVIVSFQQLTKKYPGTLIEEKESSVAFHYRTAGYEDRGRIHKEILKLFNQVYLRIPTLELLEGNFVIEIKPNEFNKGQIAEILLSSCHFDFILAAGDDKTDEFLFQKLDREAFSIKIGTEATTANYIINDRETLIQFLLDLTPQ